MRMRGGMERQLFSLTHQFLLFEEDFHLFNKGEEGKEVATIKLRNEREMIGISAHPEAEKLEEQHHNAQYAHTSFLLALNWLLFELWG
jgi:hypothetical protein